MKQYKIYQHPSGTIDAVKQGWSWPAFFFPTIWLLIKRLWGLVAVLLCLNFILYFVVETAGWFFLIGTLGRFVFGAFGNLWRENNLISRVFEHVGTIEADTPSAALVLYQKSGREKGFITPKNEAPAAQVNSDAYYTPSPQHPASPTSDTTGSRTMADENVQLWKGSPKEVRAAAQTRNATPSSQYSANIASTSEQAEIDDNLIYEQIANELETGNTDKGLWTRLFAECDGDEKKTRTLYIKQRVEAIRARLLATMNANIATAKFNKTLAAAEQGNADAQFNLGRMYLNGDGVARDNEQGVAWISKAAKQGSASALQVLLIKAEQGDAITQFNLGQMYLNGEGVAKDDGQAIVWLQKATELGNKLAQQTLLMKAAELGNADAQFHLGKMYLSGEGIAKNNAQAVVWLKKAANQGHELAQQALRTISVENYQTTDVGDSKNILLIAVLLVMAFSIAIIPIVVVLKNLWMVYGPPRFPY